MRCFLMICMIISEYPPGMNTVRSPHVLQIEFCHHQNHQLCPLSVWFLWMTRAVVHHWCILLISIILIISQPAVTFSWTMEENRKNSVLIMAFPKLHLSVMNECCGEIIKFRVAQCRRSWTNKLLKKNTNQKWNGAVSIANNLGKIIACFVTIMALISIVAELTRLRIAMVVSFVQFCVSTFVLWVLNLVPKLQLLFVWSFTSNNALDLSWDWRFRSHRSLLPTSHVWTSLAIPHRATV